MRPALVRDLVAKGLASVFEGEREADRVLDKLLRRHRDLASAERAAIARRVLGIACLRGRLDFRLDQACPGWRERPLPFRVAAYVHLEEGSPLEAAAAEAGLELPAVAGLTLPARWPAEPTERLAAEHSLPRWLAERWHREFGSEAPALAEATNRPGPAVLRANALKAERSDLRRRLSEEGIPTRERPLSPWALEVVGRANLFGCPSWREGLFEVQDEGSQLVALGVGARPGERVIDFCAGAGGKALALAAMMQDRGEILALDPDPLRLVNLASRLRRAGTSIVRTLRISPDGPLPAAVGAADRVLVDAPCSSLGTLRRSPDLRWRLAPGSIAEFARLQEQILERASACVRPGGLLVYATCTLTGEENEGVAAGFGRAHPEWPREGEPLRLFPHREGTDGFFECAWRRPLA